MKKNVQLCINETVEHAYQACMDEFKSEIDTLEHDRKRLRSCTAWVYETTNYYILLSYGTFIACIDKKTDTCFDFLRLVYGFTSTSAHHIAKFRNDYGNDKWGCRYEMRYYPV